MYFVYAFVVFLHAVIVLMIASSWNINSDNATFGEVTRKGTIQIGIVVLGLLWAGIAFASGAIKVVY